MSKSPSTFPTLLSQRKRVDCFNCTKVIGVGSARLMLGGGTDNASDDIAIDRSEHESEVSVSKLNWLTVCLTKREEPVMLFSIASPTVPDHYLLTHFLAITHADFSSTPANLSLVPWYRIRAELCHGRSLSTKKGGINSGIKD